MDHNSGIDSNGTFGMDVDNDEVQSINNYYGLHDNSDNRELQETWIPKCDSKVKPYVGQLFSNIDTSFDFYTNYGSLGGFTIRDDSVSCEVDSSSSFVSDSSTNKCDDDSGKKKRRTMSSKCECNAKMVVKFAGRERYSVSKFFEEHNHELASESEKQFLDLIGLLPYSKPCVVLMDKNETTDNSFAYEYQTDSSGHLTRIFWVDARGRESYNLFGDVLSVDATYRTNKYSMVFVPFIGIDNHGKSITFAAALLDKEDTMNFAWLFEVFLRIMGRPPKCIITDQCPAMRAVIPNIFPKSTIHRFCMWHIVRKFPSKLGTVFCAESPFMEKLKRFVWNDHVTPAEFEESWISTLKEFKLENNHWLSEIYEIRKSWIPAYFRDDPMAGLLRTTSRSESSNFFFNHFVQKGDTLCEFYMCYESAIEKQRYTNKKLNHEDKCMPKPVTIKPIEKDAAIVYTRAIFYKVQDEIKYSVNMELDTCTVVDGVKKFMIKDFFVKDKLFEVDVILDTQNVTCSCKMFTRIGYPCRHAFYCLSACGIHKIPRDLLSKRWMKNAEKMHSTLDLGENSKSDSKEGKVIAKSQDVWFEFQGCLTDVSGDEDLLEYVL
ncbi:hypothetical protein POM88_016589 [Heracleum sosnowskyi]|uniref:SWIM-type domain-containing protein n=1 Tax=Heracleum sosnowskyi TaxID=360622 RepID=A0AAD8MX22_9APIA|nr:hypothetical protein POM88_016589 [Heracleum sosnowskyi]